MWQAQAISVTSYTPIEISLQEMFFCETFPADTKTSQMIKVTEVTAPLLLKLLCFLL